MKNGLEKDYEHSEKGSKELNKGKRPNWETGLQSLMETDKRSKSSAPFSLLKTDGIPGFNYKSYQSNTAVLPAWYCRHFFEERPWNSCEYQQIHFFIPAVLYQFKGGQELAHSGFSYEIMYSLLFGLGLASMIPLYTFIFWNEKLTVSDSGAVAASYSSVSAVTFVAAVSFLEAQKMTSDGYMVAVMALMESPAIIVAVILMKHYSKEINEGKSIRLKYHIYHSLTNGSVLIILGSLLIGLIADSRQAEGIKPFTTDIFKGLSHDLSPGNGHDYGKAFSAFRKYGWFCINLCHIDSLLSMVVWLLTWASTSHKSRQQVHICDALRPVLLTLQYPQPCVWQHPKQTRACTYPWRWVSHFHLISLLACPLYFLVINHGTWYLFIPKRWAVMGYKFYMFLLIKMDLFK